MNYQDQTLREILAGEYVLGTRRGAARRRFERLMKKDPGLRERVEFWEGRFNLLAEAVSPVTPPERVWTVVEDRTAGARRGDGGIWNALSFWRGLALTASGLAVALMVYVGLRPAPEAPPAGVAVLADEARQAAWTVTLVVDDSQAKRLKVTALPSVAPKPDRSFELWLLPESGAAPVSLGLLPEAGSAVLAVPGKAVPALSRTSALAVSLEPRGGSPTGAPTGPVLYQGRLLAL
ncbi:MAG: anti-sigma factor [Betaproteobacteria bacterium]|nr:anti-sigma factor [Betaproteobacteria bacterium]